MNKNIKRYTFKKLPSPSRRTKAGTAEPKPQPESSGQPHHEHQPHRQRTPRKAI